MWLSYANPSYIRSSLRMNPIHGFTAGTLAERVTPRLILRVFGKSQGPSGHNRFVSSSSHRHKPENDGKIDFACIQGYSQISRKIVEDLPMSLAWSWLTFHSAHRLRVGTWISPAFSHRLDEGISSSVIFFSIFVLSRLMIAFGNESTLFGQTSMVAISQTGQRSAPTSNQGKKGSQTSKEKLPSRERYMRREVRADGREESIASLARPQHFQEGGNPGSRTPKIYLKA